MFGLIITGVIFGVCALIMFGIGISQFRSSEPVGFYTGIKPPTRDEISDVEAWNKKHAIMWIVYGCCIVISWMIGFFIGSGNILVVVPYFVGLIVSIIAVCQSQPNSHFPVLCNGLLFGHMTVYAIFVAQLLRTALRFVWILLLKNNDMNWSLSVRTMILSLVSIFI